MMYYQSLLLLSVVLFIAYVQNKYIKIKVINVILNLFSALILESLILNYYLLIRDFNMIAFGNGICNLITGYEENWTVNVLINGFIVLGGLIYLTYALSRIGGKIRAKYERKNQVVLRRSSV